MDGAVGSLIVHAGRFLGCVALMGAVLVAVGSTFFCMAGEGGGDGANGGGGGGGGTFVPTVTRSGRVIAAHGAGELILEGGERVRYAGMAVPSEGERCGAEAASRNEEIIGGRIVGLDVCEASPKDASGRTVAYVVFEGDETFVNRVLVAEGWALASADEPCGKETLSEFLSLEKQAQNGRRGIHGTNCSGDPGGPVGTIEIDVAHSVFDPPGDDVDHLNDEYLVLRARGGDVGMTGWKVSNAIGLSYTFPPFRLLRDASVKLHTGRGVVSPTDLYWGLDHSAWNDLSDEVTVRDADGKVVAHYRYG